MGSVAGYMWGKGASSGSHLDAAAAGQCIWLVAEVGGQH